MTRHPQYYRDYFYIFTTTGKDVPEDMFKFLIKEYDLELVGEECTFIVKGAKENVEACVSKYSEFLENWEKIDKRIITIWAETERLHNKVKDLTYFFEENRKGLVNKEEYNKEIDTIIVGLKKLKVV
jgi:hypothetical protein